MRMLVAQLGEIQGMADLTDDFGRKRFQIGLGSTYPSQRLQHDAYISVLTYSVNVRRSGDKAVYPPN